MKTIEEFKKYIVHWDKKEQTIAMLEYIGELEGEKLDYILEAIMNKLRDQTQSTTLASNGLRAIINENFLDSSVSYHKYIKARNFMERSQENEKNN